MLKIVCFGCICPHPECQLRCQAGRKLHRSAKFEIPKVLCSALVNKEVKGDSYMEYNF